MIAEFMGWTLDDSHLKSYRKRIGGVFKYVHQSQLKYDTDWNCLMPVVDKIENIRMKQHENSMEYNVMIEQQRCIITSETQGEICYFVGNIGGKIAVVYDAVVSFIKWYNEQNPKS